MTLRRTYRIGPAIVALQSSRPPRPDEPDPFYEAFRIPDAPAADLTIDLREDPAPPRTEDQPIVEFVNQWRLFENPKGRRLEILEQIRFEPRLIALISPSWDRIDLFQVPLSYELPDEPAEGWVTGEIMEPLVQWWLTAWLVRGKKGLILHGSAVSMDGMGHAFVGPSGAGKTTLALLCRGHARAEVLNDERIVLWREPGGWRAGGSPWVGEGHVVSPLTAPLARLCLLKKSVSNRFSRLPARDAVPRILPECFLPLWDARLMSGLLEAAAGLAEDVPCGELEFLKDAGAVDCLRSLERLAGAG